MRNQIVIGTEVEKTPEQLKVDQILAARPQIRAIVNLGTKLLASDDEPALISNFELLLLLVDRMQTFLSSSIDSGPVDCPVLPLKLLKNGD